MNTDSPTTSAGGASETEPSRLERLCVERGMRMTEQRRVIARVMSDADDHPDVEEIHAPLYSYR